MKNHSLLLLMLVLTLAACGKKTDDAPTAAAVPADAYLVRLDTVRPAGAAGDVQLIGLVASDSEGKPAFKTGGVIASVSVGEGDAVQAGQVVARLNLQEIEAQVAQAELGLQKARRDFARAENLYRDSVATQEQYLNAQTALDLAAKQLEIAQFNRTYSTAKAPIGGRVVKLLARAGEIVGPGQPLMLIQGTNASNWVVRCSVTDEQWASLRLRDKASIRFDAYPEVLANGYVSDLGTMANPTGGTFPVEFTLQGNTQRLAAGLVARVQLNQGAASSTTLQVPLTALAEADGQQAVVFVPDARQRVQRRVVNIGALHETWVEVISGLQPGEAVVSTGAGWLRDGDSIIVDKE